MRQIGTLVDEMLSKRLSAYLKKIDIANSIEVSFDPASGHIDYQVWVTDEDKLEDAIKVFEEFQKNPNDSKYDAPPPEPEPLPQYEDVKGPPTRQFKNHLTHFFIGVCVLVFFLNLLQMTEIRQKGVSEKVMTLTPIMADLMYDLPPEFKELEELESRSGEGAERASVEALSTPFFQGIYGWVVAKFKKESTKQVEGELFIQIRKGEIWRLFTPCLLHKDLLHILFNMLWLWYLGRPIERRIGPFRMLIFTLLAGVFTNTVQYFMSGPFFIGYSGIVTALAGFIWMRERVAPWEGYPLNRGTILFLLFFIVAILGLQIVAFFIDILANYTFAPNIANAAHISGLIFGALLAKLSFFEQRVKK